MRINLLEVKALNSQDVENLKSYELHHLLGFESSVVDLEKINERCRQLLDKFNPERKDNDADFPTEVKDSVMGLIIAAKEKLIGTWGDEGTQKPDENEQKAIRLQNHRIELEHRLFQEREEESSREKESRDLLTKDENEEFQLLCEQRKKEVFNLKSAENDKKFNAEYAANEAKRKQTNDSRNELSEGNWSGQPSSHAIVPELIDKNTDGSFFHISQITMSSEPTDKSKKINLFSVVNLCSEKGGIDPGSLQLGVSNLDIVGCETEKDLLKDYNPDNTEEVSETKIRADERYAYITSSAVLYKKADHAVLNIGAPLNLGKNILVGDVSSAEYFQTFFSDLVNAGVINDKIDCIQMPMILSEQGRKHFVQVQFFNYREKETVVKGIYKTQAISELGVRVIDSTGNPFSMPNKRLKGFVEKVAPAVDALLKIKSPKVRGQNATKKVKFRIHTLFTEKQSSRPIISHDNKCGLYVLGWIKAVTDQVLAEGDHFLSNNDSVKRIVLNEHHCVNKSRVENYFLSRVLRSIFSNDEKNKTVSSNFDVLCQKLQLGDSHNLSDATPVIEKNQTASVVRIEENASSHSMSQSNVPPLDFSRLNKEKLTTEEPMIAFVKKALKKYKEKHRTFGSLFRHLSTSGLRYADQAETRINFYSKDNQAAVCKQIAQEILSQALTSDGCIEVNRNSRVYWLLKEMQVANVISNDVDNMIGKKVSVKAIAINEPLQMKDYSPS